MGMISRHLFPISKRRSGRKVNKSWTWVSEEDPSNQARQSIRRSRRAESVRWQQAIMVLRNQPSAVRREDHYLACHAGSAVSTRGVVRREGRLRWVLVHVLADRQRRSQRRTRGESIGRTAAHPGHREPFVESSREATLAYSYRGCSFRGLVHLLRSTSQSRHFSVIWRGFNYQ